MATNTPFFGWIPGVLCKPQVSELAQIGYIQGLTDKLIDHSSFDLTLDDEGYCMKDGAVKPFGDYEMFLQKLVDAKVADRLRPNGNGDYLLEAKATYVFRLEQKLGPKI